MIRALRLLQPALPAVACFDTAFHRTLPLAASTYAVPSTWTERWGLRRFGFHGLSHAYASRRAAELLDRPASEMRVVTAHLGAGASLAAVAGGRSVDTTMGFTPLEGLVMATRSGSVDPGLVLWVQRHDALDARAVERALEHESGLLGISNRSSSVNELLDAAAGGDELSSLAIDVYLHRLRAGIAAMAAAMDGLDALVFTGGVGEGSEEIRERACAGLTFLGLGIDSAANASADGEDLDLSAAEALSNVLKVHAREDLQIAAGVRECLGSRSR
jgi:acetate kinase